MGVTISSKGSDKRLYMSYGTFDRLRTVIARKLNKPFGDHYSCIATCEDRKKWEDRINQLIIDEHLAETKRQELLLDFFFQSDTEGTISYGTAKTIYELIKTEPNEDRYGYAGWADCSTMGDFKQLLQDAYDNKKPVRWS